MSNLCHICNQFQKPQSWDMSMDCTHSTLRTSMSRDHRLQLSCRHLCTCKWNHQCMELCSHTCYHILPPVSLHLLHLYQPFFSLSLSFSPS
uniref:Uncharacterized protein n=1 Tax=Glycine max TaxID=3847 RepID=C6SYX4_SOYBN|nr:unknown [Glycine max]